MCTICLAKTKALISFAVTAKLICVFVFAYMQIVGFLTRWLILLIMHFRQLSTPELRLFDSFMTNASKVFYVEAVHVYYALIN